MTPVPLHASKQRSAAATAAVQIDKSLIFRQFLFDDGRTA
jgi:hypothetical protein